MVGITGLYPPETCPGSDLVCPECPGPQTGLESAEPQAPIEPDVDQYGWRLGGPHSLADHMTLARKRANKLDEMLCRLGVRYQHPSETSSTHRKAILARQLVDARSLHALLEKEILENRRMKVTFESMLEKPGWRTPRDPEVIPFDRRIAAVEECLGILEAAKAKYDAADLDQLDLRLIEAAQERAEKEKRRKAKLEMADDGEAEADGETEAEGDGEGEAPA